MRKVKVKWVKLYVLQGLWDNDWHDICTYNSWTRKKAYHDLFLETDYPKRIIERKEVRVCF